jgi:signal transduction histidine kinase
MGGTVSVDSTEGVGTTFSIYLSTKIKIENP